MRMLDRSTSELGLQRAHHRFARLCLAPVLLMVAMVSSPARASTLEIQFAGLNLDYDGTNIFDSKNHNTSGSGNPADADPLNQMTFLVDNVLVGSVLTSDIFADIYIAGVTNVPAGGGIVNSSGNGGAFGVDLLTSSSNPGWGLALDINSMQFSYTGSNIAITIAGVASNIATQMLPFGLAFDPGQPVTIVLSSSALTNVTTDGTYVTSLNAAGTGNVAGTYVPEPTGFVLAAMSIVGLAACVWRRKRRA